MNLFCRVAAAFAFATFVAAPLAAQTSWPDKPVKLVVGFTAGSATDVSGRIFAHKFAEMWGQPVVVENVPGNSGAIGTDRVAKANPDGYTLLWSGNAAITILPSLQKLPFDPLKDLAPITTTLVTSSILFVNNDMPVKSLAELIAYAKANPGKLSYGSPGVGTPQHVATELLSSLAGIKMEHIPYRGANLTDVMSGVVPVGIQNAGAAMPFVNDGRVRGLALTAQKRAAGAPSLPTVAEQGFPGFEAVSWFALMAPTGTPKPILDKVRADALKVLADPEVQKKFLAIGLEVVGSTAEETRAAIAADIPKWEKVIKDANIKVGK
ncbi:MAG: Bug family tripartite tricarboxylate transporter substrate binding protein [Reyranella sp.]|uniref:Bug family tripartite tricarboxylate transporter substrate binding protein n=1 Tax=Reyranella sp. TaxID=1929291 RepID=UPI003D0A647A